MIIDIPIEIKNSLNTLGITFPRKTYIDSAKFILQMKYGADDIYEFFKLLPLTDTWFESDNNILNLLSIIDNTMVGYNNFVEEAVLTHPNIFRETPWNHATPNSILSILQSCAFSIPDIGAEIIKSLVADINSNVQLCFLLRKLSIPNKLSAEICTILEKDDDIVKKLIMIDPVCMSKFHTNGTINLQGVKTEDARNMISYALNNDISNFNFMMNYRMYIDLVCEISYESPRFNLFNDLITVVQENWIGKNIYITLNLLEGINKQNITAYCAILNKISIPTNIIRNLVGFSVLDKTLCILSNSVVVYCVESGTHIIRDEYQDLKFLSDTEVQNIFGQGLDKKLYESKHTIFYNLLVNKNYTLEDLMSNEQFINFTDRLLDEMIDCSWEHKQETLEKLIKVCKLDISKLKYDEYCKKLIEKHSSGVENSEHIIDCPICMERNILGNFSIEMACGKILCKKCCQRLSETKGKVGINCPYCRSEAVWISINH